MTKMQLGNFFYVLTVVFMYLGVKVGSSVLIFQIENKIMKLEVSKKGTANFLLHFVYCLSNMVQCPPPPFKHTHDRVFIQKQIQFGNSSKSCIAFVQINCGKQYNSKRVLFFYKHYVESHCVQRLTVDCSRGLDRPTLIKTVVDTLKQHTHPSTEII